MSLICVDVPFVIMGRFCLRESVGKSRFAKALSLHGLTLLLPV